MVTVAELESDPYPVYARLRGREPVTWIPEIRQWLVTGWHDVRTVLTDVQRFTTDQPGSPLLDLCGGTPLLLREGESHQDVREAFRHDFDAHRVNDFVDTVARPVASRIADEVVTSGRADLAADYFEPVAAIAMTTLLGLDPGAGADTLRQWGNLLTQVANNFGRDPAVDRSAAGSLADDAAVTEVVRRLRTEPDRSVISHLLHAHRPRGDARPDADVVPVVKHLALSVIEPGWLAGWTLVALWSAPDQLATVRADRGLLGAAVYEALRWSAPVGVLGRRTTRTATLGGRELPAGSMIAAAIASANRDETVFTEPDRFDLHRDVRTHLGFGAGPHHCPAHPLVTALARTALDVLFERIPGVRPAPGWQPEPHGWKLRLPGPLAAVWDATPSRHSWPGVSALPARK
ncbi:cytochrome P450 [Kibdelosporangium persicum]|uniref:Cytochrome P450 hydroxylase n=1 Tax=Kibdelosporangium persicum TaxID=2698649 RepID=A0ABX2FE69_9PSEU|nr:cytochrome P450 [Kibdelosporangium persicum]NRN69434.1 putative cytochrome P450 hydroxylase [Kibdelosporangium persicum]